jgi:hypothetical protein
MRESMVQFLRPDVAEAQASSIKKDLGAPVQGIPQLVLEIRKEMVSYPGTARWLVQVAQEKIISVAGHIRKTIAAYEKTVPFVEQLPGRAPQIQLARQGKFG